MHWKLRALLLRAMANLPGGYAAYQFLQRHFGSHCDPEFYRSKLRMQRDAARLILDSGGTLAGTAVMEVGTGWLPLTSVAFWICGAAQVRTYDVNRHLLAGVFRRALGWLTTNQDEIVALWDGIVSPDRVVGCLGAIRDGGCQPGATLDLAHIAYHAPADASATNLPGASIDIHYSTDVLEHVPPGGIEAILREARRVLKPEGRSVHIVDPRDHFALTDSRVSVINFLQYSDRQWQQYAGHYLAYHNRLRDPAFQRLFEDTGFEVLEHHYEVDARALQELEQGFALAPEFRGFDGDQLCRCNLSFVGRPTRT
jgi:SAM-dependent methyltransferase